MPKVSEFRPPLDSNGKPMPLKNPRACEKKDDCTFNKWPNIEGKLWDTIKLSTSIPSQHWWHTYRLKKSLTRSYLKVVAIVSKMLSEWWEPRVCCRTLTVSKGWPTRIPDIPLGRNFRNRMKWWFIWNHRFSFTESRATYLRSIPPRSRKHTWSLFRAHTLTNGYRWICTEIWRLHYFVKRGCNKRKRQGTRSTSHGAQMRPEQFIAQAKNPLRAVELAARSDLYGCCPRNRRTLLTIHKWPDFRPPTDEQGRGWFWNNLKNKIFSTISIAGYNS